MILTKSPILYNSPDQQLDRFRPSGFSPFQPPFSPPSGSATGSFNGLHIVTKFQVVMNTTHRILPALWLRPVLFVLTMLSQAMGADYSFYNAGTVPITSAGYSIVPGTNVNLSLGFAPATGTNLTLINNTGADFIQGRFANLAQGQSITLTYRGASYNYVVNYYGGTGNDLVLQWAGNKLVAWGFNTYGELGNGNTTDSNVPITVTASGVLAGKTVVATSASGPSLALCSDGTVAAWGMNNNGQLGNGTTTDSSVPVMVTHSGCSPERRS